MKYFTNKVSNLVVLLATFLFIASCNDVGESNEDDMNGSDVRLENKKSEDDGQFLITAAEINLKEIQLGQLAQQIGISAHVRDLGKMMEDAHIKSFNELKALAQSKTLAIPNAPTENAQQTCNTLKQKVEISFDKAYADMMVSEHKDAIVIFEKATKDCKDDDIRNWAATMLSSLRTNLDNSIDCQSKCEANITMNN